MPPEEIWELIAEHFPVFTFYTDEPYPPRKPSKHRRLCITRTTLNSTVYLIGLSDPTTGWSVHVDGDPYNWTDRATKYQTHAEAEAMWCSIFDGTNGDVGALEAGYTDGSSAGLRQLMDEALTFLKTADIYPIVMLQ
jgi:hypothetical protein